MNKKKEKNPSSNNFSIGTEKKKVYKEEKERGREMHSSQLFFLTLLNLLLFSLDRGYQNHKYVDKEV